MENTLSPGTRRRFKKWTSALLSAVLFFTHCAFASVVETGLWSDRQRALSARITPALLPLPALRSASLNSHWTEIRRTPSSLLARLTDIIPAQYGTLRDLALPAAGFKDTLVIHFQDIHGHTEAQANLARALGSLLNHNDVDLVAVEGAAGPVNLEFLNEFPDKKALADVAAFELERNEISGPLFTLLTHERRVPVVGLENERAYERNVDAVRQAWPLRKTMTRDLLREERSLNARKKEIFNKQLQEFDGQVARYRSGELGIGEYAQRLAAHSPEISLNTQLFLSAFELEKKWDEARINSERARFFEELVPRLEQAELNNLKTISVSYQTGALSHADYHDALLKLCAIKGVSLQRYPAFDDYIRYVLLTRGVKADQLFRDLTAMETRAYQALVKTPAEAELIRAARQLHLQNKLTDFSLTKDEYVSLRAERSNLSLPQINSENQIAALPSGARNDRPFASFYEVALQRDDIMSANLLSAIKQSRAKIVVLVTGGFHSAGIARALHQKGVATVQFVPQLSKIDNERGSEYLSVFAQEKAPLEQLFQGDRLFLSKPFLARAQTLGLRLSAIALAFARGTVVTPLKYFGDLTKQGWRLVWNRTPQKSAIATLSRAGSRPVQAAVTLVDDRLTDIQTETAGFDWRQARVVIAHPLRFALALTGVAALVAAVVVKGGAWQLVAGAPAVFGVMFAGDARQLRHLIERMFGIQLEYESAERLRQNLSWETLLAEIGGEGIDAPQQREYFNELLDPIKVEEWHFIPDSLKPSIVMALQQLNLYRSFIVSTSANNKGQLTPNEPGKGVLILPAALVTQERKLRERGAIAPGELGLVARWIVSRQRRFCFDFTVYELLYELNTKHGQGNYQPGALKDVGEKLFVEDRLHWLRALERIVAKNLTWTKDNYFSQMLHEVNQEWLLGQNRVILLNAKRENHDENYVLTLQNVDLEQPYVQFELGDDNVSLYITQDRALGFVVSPSQGLLPVWDHQASFPMERMMIEMVKVVISIMTIKYFRQSAPYNRWTIDVETSHLGRFEESMLPEGSELRHWYEHAKATMPEKPVADLGEELFTVIKLFFAAATGIPTAALAEYVKRPLPAHGLFVFLLGQKLLHRTDINMQRVFDIANVQDLVQSADWLEKMVDALVLEHPDWANAAVDFLGDNAYLPFYESLIEAVTAMEQASRFLAHQFLGVHNNMLDGTHVAFPDDFPDGQHEPMVRLLTGLGLGPDIRVKVVNNSKVSLSVNDKFELEIEIPYVFQTDPAGVREGVELLLPNEDTRPDAILLMRYQKALSAYVASGFIEDLGLWTLMQSRPLYERRRWGAAMAAAISQDAMLSRLNETPLARLRAFARELNVHWFRHTTMVPLLAQAGQAKEDPQVAIERMAAWRILGPVGRISVEGEEATIASVRPLYAKVASNRSLDMLHPTFGLMSAVQINNLHQIINEIATHPQPATSGRRYVRELLKKNSVPTLEDLEKWGLHTLAFVAWVANDLERLFGSGNDQDAFIKQNAALVLDRYFLDGAGAQMRPFFRDLENHASSRFYVDLMKSLPQSLPDILSMNGEDPLIMTAMLILDEDGRSDGSEMTSTGLFTLYLLGYHFGVLDKPLTVASLTQLMTHDELVDRVLQALSSKSVQELGAAVREIAAREFRRPGQISVEHNRALEAEDNYFSFGERETGRLHAALKILVRSQLQDFTALYEVGDMMPAPFQQRWWALIVKIEKHVAARKQQGWPLTRCLAGLLFILNQDFLVEHDLLIHFAGAKLNKASLLESMVDRAKFWKIQERRVAGTVNDKPVYFANGSVSLGDTAAHAVSPWLTVTNTDAINDTVRRAGNVLSSMRTVGQLSELAQKLFEFLSRRNQFQPDAIRRSIELSLWYHMAATMALNPYEETNHRFETDLDIIKWQVDKTLVDESDGGRLKPFYLAAMERMGVQQEEFDFGNVLRQVDAVAGYFIAAAESNLYGPPIYTFYQSLVTIDRKKPTDPLALVFVYYLAYELGVVTTPLSVSQLNMVMDNEKLLQGMLIGLMSREARDIQNALRRIRERDIKIQLPPPGTPRPAAKPAAIAENETRAPEPARAPAGEQFSFSKDFPENLKPIVIRYLQGFGEQRFTLTMRSKPARRDAEGVIHLCVSKEALRLEEKMRSKNRERWVKGQKRRLEPNEFGPAVEELKVLMTTVPDAAAEVTRPESTEKPTETAVTEAAAETAPMEKTETLSTPDITPIVTPEPPALEQPKPKKKPFHPTYQEFEAAIRIHNGDLQRVADQFGVSIVQVSGKLNSWRRLKILAEGLATYPGLEALLEMIRRCGDHRGLIAQTAGVSLEILEIWFQRAHDQGYEAQLSEAMQETAALIALTDDPELLEMIGDEEPGDIVEFLSNKRSQSIDQVQSVVRLALEGLHTADEDTFINFDVTGPALETSPIPAATDDGLLTITVQVPARYQHVRVRGGYNRMWTVPVQAQAGEELVPVTLNLPLARVGKANEFKIYAVDVVKKTRTEVLTVQVRRNKLPEVLTEDLDKLRGWSIEELERLEKEENRQRALQAMTERGLLRAFSVNKKKAYLALAKAIEFAESPAMRKLLEAIQAKFKDVDNLRFPWVRDAKTIPFYTRYLVLEIRRARGEGRAGIALFVDHDLRPDLAALLAFPKEHHFIVSPRAELPTWDDLVRGTFKEPSLDTVEGRPEERAAILANPSGTRLLTNLDTFKATPGEWRLLKKDIERRSKVLILSDGHPTFSSEPKKENQKESAADRIRSLKRVFTILIEPAPPAQMSQLYRMLTVVDAAIAAQLQANGKTVVFSSPRRVAEIKEVIGAYTVRLRRSDVARVHEEGVPDLDFAIPRVIQASFDIGRYVFTLVQMEMILKVYWDFLRYARELYGDRAPDVHDNWRSRYLAVERISAEAKVPKVMQLVEDEAQAGRTSAVYVQRVDSGSLISNAAAALGAVFFHGKLTGNVPQRFEIDGEGRYRLDEHGMPIPTTDKSGREMSRLDYARRQISKDPNTKVGVALIPSARRGGRFQGVQTAIIAETPTYEQQQQMLGLLTGMNAGVPFVRIIRMLGEFPEMMLRHMPTVLRLRYFGLGNHETADTFGLFSQERRHKSLYDAPDSDAEDNPASAALTGLKEHEPAYRYDEETHVYRHPTSADDWAARDALTQLVGAALAYEQSLLLRNARLNTSHDTVEDPADVNDHVTADFTTGRQELILVESHPHRAEIVSRVRKVVQVVRDDINSYELERHPHALVDSDAKVTVVMFRGVPSWEKMVAGVGDDNTEFMMFSYWLIQRFGPTHVAQSLELIFSRINAILMNPLLSQTQRVQRLEDIERRLYHAATQLKPAEMETALDQIGREVPLSDDGQLDAVPRDFYQHERQGLIETQEYRQSLAHRWVDARLTDYFNRSGTNGLKLYYDGVVGEWVVPRLNLEVKRELNTEFPESFAKIAGLFGTSVENYRITNGAHLRELMRAIYLDQQGENLTRRALAPLAEFHRAPAPGNLGALAMLALGAPARLVLVGGLLWFPFEGQTLMHLFQTQGLHSWPLLGAAFIALHLMLVYFSKDQVKPYGAAALRAGAVFVVYAVFARWPIIGTAELNFLAPLLLHMFLIDHKPFQQIAAQINLPRELEQLPVVNYGVGDLTTEKPLEPLSPLDPNFFPKIEELPVGNIDRRRRLIDAAS